MIEVRTCQVESAEGFWQGFQVAPDGVVDPFRVEGQLLAGETFVVEAAIKSVVRPEKLLQLPHFLPIGSKITINMGFFFFSFFLVG